MVEYTVTRHQYNDAISGKKFKTLAKARSYQRENGGVVWSIKRDTDKRGGLGAPYYDDITYPSRRKKNR